MPCTYSLGLFLPPSYPQHWLQVYLHSQHLHLFVKHFLYYTSSPVLVTSCLFDNNHSKVITSLDFHLSDDSWYWASFHVPISHLYVFFLKNVYSSSLPIFKLDVFVLFSIDLHKFLIRLDINPYQIDGLEIFFPFYTLLFHFVDCFFCCCCCCSEFDVVPFIYFCLIK